MANSLPPENGDTEGPLIGLERAELAVARIVREEAERRDAEVRAAIRASQMGMSSIAALAGGIGASHGRIVDAVARSHRPVHRYLGATLLTTMPERLGGRVVAALQPGLGTVLSDLQASVASQSNLMASASSQVAALHSAIENAYQEALRHETARRSAVADVLAATNASRDALLGARHEIGVIGSALQRALGVAAPQQDRHEAQMRAMHRQVRIWDLLAAYDQGEYDQVDAIREEVRLSISEVRSLARRHKRREERERERDSALRDEALDMMYRGATPDEIATTTGVPRPWIAEQQRLMLTETSERHQQQLARRDEALGMMYRGATPDEIATTTGVPRPWIAEQQRLMLTAWVEPLVAKAVAASMTHREETGQTAMGLGGRPGSEATKPFQGATDGARLRKVDVLIALLHRHGGEWGLDDYAEAAGLRRPTLYDPPYARFLKAWKVLRTAPNSPPKGSKSDGVADACVWD